MFSSIVLNMRYWNNCRSIFKIGKTFFFLYPELIYILDCLNKIISKGIVYKINKFWFVYRICKFWTKKILANVFWLQWGIMIMFYISLSGDLLHVCVYIFYWSWTIDRDRYEIYRCIWSKCFQSWHSRIRIDKKNAITRCLIGTWLL